MTTPVSGAQPGPGRGGPGGGGPRRRKPPKPVEVVSVERVAPRMVAVFVTGDDLDAYGDAAPTSHLKVFLPAPGQDAPLLPTATPDGLQFPDGPSPVVRTYTPRRYDRASKTLEIQFLLHGTGPATEWAQRAKPGDRLAVGGPGGRFSLEPVADHWWIAADESAIPAVGTLLDALPDSVTAEVHIEAGGPDDEIEFTSPDQASRAKASVAWHYRQPDASGALKYGAELAAAARAAAIPGGARVWVACESAAMRDIRRYLISAGKAARDSIVTRGYWRAGEENHPDHDYGDD